MTGAADVVERGQGDVPDRVVPFTGLRGAVARAMQAAWSAPRVTIGMDVRFDACLAARDQRQARVGARLTPTTYVLRAVALALRRHPELNGAVHDDGIHLRDRVHLGLAVTVDGGLVVPVVRDVDARSLEEIGDEAATLADVARRGGLTPRAMQGATFTVSSLGAVGASWFTPIINAPQIAILGVGAAAPRPVVEPTGELGVATVATLTLVFDHRAVDGHEAALFLGTVRELLEDPSAL